ncbi:hypothetical protein F4805DRAFT_45674 [Annulohypoxylon moriforme]|nr:hypothetical protein F4805DRAFT_45674 [Annulohypoxylon moriforme]
MDKLSQETLSHICSFLEKKTLRRFRLVCKRFSDVGAPYICTELWIKMTYNDLQRLFNFSRQSCLAQGLRSLHYAPIGLKCPRNRDEINVPRHRGIDWLCNDEMSTLKKNQDEQYEIMERSSDFMCLFYTLTKFPRLRHIFWYFGKENKDHVDPDTHAGTRHLDVLFGVIKETGADIKGLTLQNLDWHYFYDLDNDDLKTLFEPVAKLEWLDITLDNRGSLGNLDIQYEYVFYHTRMENGTLRKCLQTLAKLHTLKVSFTSLSGDWDAENTPLNQIVPSDFTWTYLKTLRLAHVTSDRQELMEFLLRHKETLRSLCLRNVTLHNTSWIPLLAEFREKLYLTAPCVCGALTSFSENGEWFQFWDLGTENKDLFPQVNKYITRNGEVSPDMECPLTEENTIN